MSAIKSDEELRKHKDNAINVLDHFISDLIDSDDPDIKSKSDKFCYWIEDYIRFLKYERTFTPTSLKRYKRGQVIKVHLGFNVGCEEGGLHYAVVLDKNNSINSPVITVIPLTSVKPTTNIKQLPFGKIYLGNELFTNLNAQIKLTAQHLTSEMARLREVIKNMPSNDSAEELRKDIKKAEKEMELINKMSNEIVKMKKGSIALINQITTISKIRIYDPKTNHDILSHVRLSDQKLNLIDSELISNYSGQIYS